GAAGIDALLEIEQPSLRHVERRIARGDALHARAGVAVAVAAGAGGAARLPAPQRYALEHPQHAGIGAVVVLDPARLAAHEVVAGAAFRAGNLAGEGRRGHRARSQHEPDRTQCDAVSSHYSTVIFADSVTEKPLSPVQWNTIVPLSVATVENAM